MRNSRAGYGLPKGQGEKVAHGRLRGAAGAPPPQGTVSGPLPGAALRRPGISSFSDP